MCSSDLNTDQECEFQVNRGDRIAQIIFETFHLVTFEETDNLENTIRSTGGFGSSGI